MEDLIRQFGVDWKLLAAQVVNFFILLYLLKRFAYGPIVAMLNERRKKIEQGIKASNEAEQKLAEAQAKKNELLQAAETESVKIVSAAEDKASEQAQIMLRAAHEKSDQVVALGRKRLEEEQRKLEASVRDEAVDLIKQGVVKTLGKMNPTERDEVLIREALKELSTLS